MIYVTSDLHGCFKKYIQMLKKINLSRTDTLYILGDVIDRGDDGIKILLDIMHRPNVIPILGNHEYMAYKVLSKLNVEITEENYATHLDVTALRMYQEWIYNGGAPTSLAFSKLSRSQKADVLDYIREFEVFEKVGAGGKDFILLHGGLGNFAPQKDLYDYTLEEIIWSRCDYKMCYFPDKYLVTGHTPTCYIDKSCDGKIFLKNNHIAIDCGASLGKNLGCICLDTLEKFYV